MQPSTFSTRLAACGEGEGGARPSELAAALDRRAREQLE